MTTLSLGVLALAFLTGWAFGQPVVFLLLAALGLLYWQGREEKKLLAWMRRNSRLPPDDLPPVLEEVAAIAMRRAEKSRRRKRRYQDILKNFHELSQAMPDPAMIVDDAGHLQSFNKAAHDAFGLHNRLDIGARIQHLIRNEAFQQFWESTADSALIKIGRLEQTRWMEMAKVPLSRGDILLLARDVSRIVELDLKRKAFIDNASHELKTPITVLSGFIEWLQSTDTPEHFALPLAQMHEQATRLRTLVDDMLILAGLERPGMHLRLQTVALPAFLQHIAQTAQHQFPDSAGIALGDIPDVHPGMDETLMRSAVENLLTNALAHAQSRQPVRLNADVSGDTLHIHVEDDGIGIAAAHLPRITERFYRVDQTRHQAKGSGLGLAIVKHIMDVHGGQLCIRSSVGQGSRFTLSLPLRQPSTENTKNTEK